MPQRTRSHELEDESIEAFKASIPKRWVCREKGRDYGVDLEVEIFGDDRHATGLMFYVQLKATDNISRSRNSSILVDRIRYLSLLGHPAIIVRYCSVDESLHWIWNFNAATQIVGSPKEVTVNFKNPWTSDTPFEISSGLRKMRRLNAADRDERFPVVEIFDVPFAQILNVEKVLSAIKLELPFLVKASDDSTALTLSMQFAPSKITIALEPIGFLELQVKCYDTKYLTQLLAFGLTSVFLRMGFAERALSTARLCLSLGPTDAPIPSELVLAACNALKAAPEEATRLAIQAGFHKQHDSHYLAFVSQIFTSASAPAVDVGIAIRLFYSASLTVAKDDSHRSAVFYSLGNSRSANHEYAKAVAAFNSARKARPSYLKSGYFLSELGGSLFLGRRYKCSVKAYRAANKVEYSEKSTFCLGDALLYSREFIEAISVLSPMKSSSDLCLSGEARLKCKIAAWFDGLEAKLSPDNVSSLMVQADKYNVSGDAEARYIAVLAAAFAAKWDNFLWSLAIEMSLSCCPVSEVTDVILISVESCGVEPYRHLRNRLREFADSEEAFTQLDELCVRAREIVGSRKRPSFTVRLLDGESVQTLVRRPWNSDNSEL